MNGAAPGRRGPAAVSILFLLIGCERPSSPPAAPPVAAAPPHAEAPAWHDVDGSEVMTISPAQERDFFDAIQHARNGAADARLRWEAASAEERRRWAVLWAAPTADAGVEYLWVLPQTWSEIRVEGTLASPPQRELANGKVLAELVSFPTEEISDWALFTDERYESIVAGGFTLRALVQ